MTKMKFLAATAAIAMSLSASNASATIYTVSIAIENSSIYAFNLDSTTGTTAGLFKNVAYTINGVAAGTSNNVRFTTSQIALDPIFLQKASGPFPVLSGSAPNVSLTTGTFQVYEASQTGDFTGFNNATLTISTQDAVTPAVPEPATWAMMVGGFGLVGGSLRRRGKGIVRFA